MKVLPSRQFICGALTQPTMTQVFTATVAKFALPLRASYLYFALAPTTATCGKVTRSAPSTAAQWDVDDILLTRTLRDQGFDDRELRRMRRDGTLLPVRRGAYVRERPAERTRDDQHRELVFATALQLRDAAVISHGSAAVLHGLPIWQTAIDRVHVTRNRNSESAGESVSRVRLHEEGLPTPELQQSIYDDHGQFVARVDFCWQEHRTIAEFDGKIKYGRMLKSGQSVEDVLFAEKRREDALRDLGWQIVRWLWADLYRRGIIRDRVLRAFARSV
jgi:very-short-patch-repair endonuclease